MAGRPRYRRPPRRAGREDRLGVLRRDPLLLLRLLALLLLRELDRRAAGRLV